jgi:hypothetical protein
MVTAFLDTEGSACVAVEYEKVILDPDSELARMGMLLGMSDDPVLSARRQEFGSGFVDRGLQHNNQSNNDLQGHPSVPREIWEIYSAMAELASGSPCEAQWLDIRKRCRELWKTWWPRQVSLCSGQSVDESSLRESLAKVARLRSELLAEHAGNLAATAQISAQAALIGEKDAEIVRLRSQLSLLVDQAALIGEKDAEIVRLRSQLSLLVDQAALIGEKDAEIFGLRSQLSLLVEQEASSSSLLKEASSELHMAKRDLEANFRKLQRYELMLKMSGLDTSA